jgi:7-cyano-7-deazaguanine synthase
MSRPKTMERAIVLVSGGIDSTVALWHALRQGWDIDALSFDYHLRPRQEVAATGRLLAAAGIDRHIRLPIPFLMELDDLRLAGYRLDHLASAPAAYIPARNMIFYSLAAHYAEVLEARWIVGGHNSGDVEGFPDTSAAFFDAFHSLCRRGVRSYLRAPFEVIRPLAGMSKREVVRYGRRLGAPLELTWSCYWDGKSPCGTCPSCLEREEVLRE